MSRRLRALPDPNRHRSDAGCFASDSEIDCIAELILQGQNGRDGRDGQSFFQPNRGCGRNGNRGGDATRAFNGQSGGSVDYALSYAHDDRRRGELLLDGSIAAPDEQPQRSQSSVTIGETGYVFIQAGGGKGGNGGRGGNGQPGAPGCKGRDATRYSNGGNGGPGGNGGNAGNPTDGANGGHGGHVNLTVRDRDIGLLMLVKGNLVGGEIGFAGEPGIGGAGGPGGPGGNSYHWTETRTYRDSNGNTQTRTVFRSNPGGMRGRRGHNGANSFYRAKDGIPGTTGLLQIFVVDPQGNEQVYPAPFDLELVTFDVVSEYTILEPDSIVSIDNLTVRNRGRMPTPDNYTIRIDLPSDDWILWDECSLVMHQTLQPDETYTFRDVGLRFRLGDHIVDSPRKQPFSLRHMVSPAASMESGIHRPFRQFENGEEIKVQFPVELVGITALNSLAPGESTRVIWGIKNISDETFDHKYLYRAVQANLKLIGGDLNLESVAFFDDQDREHDLIEQPFQKPIAELKPGETRVIETRIGIEDHDDIVPYQGFAIGVDLFQQRPRTSESNTEYRCVDYRKTFIRVAERYLKEDSSRFLLVANQKTDVQDIDKWTQLADYFGSTLDVWDVSYNGFFDLVREVQRDKSLLEQWQGMTIIIPNNYYQTPNGKTAAFQELAKSQFLKAAADYDINFYIVGDTRTGGAEMLANSLIPVDDSLTPGQIKSQNEFLREIKRWSKYIQRSHEVVGGQMKDAHAFADDAIGPFHELEINKRTFLFQPKRKWLEEEAKRLQTKLKKTDPLHRWVIVHRYDTGDTDTSWGFFRKRKVGKLGSPPHARFDQGIGRAV